MRAIGSQEFARKLYAKTIKAPQVNKQATKWTDAQHRKLAELGSMRVWSLKKALGDRLKEMREMKGEAK